MGRMDSFLLLRKDTEIQHISLLIDGLFLLIRSCVYVYISLVQPLDLALFLPPLDHAPLVEEERGVVRNWSTTCASSRALVPIPRCPSWKM